MIKVLLVIWFSSVTSSFLRPRIAGGTTAATGVVPSFVAIRIEWTRGTRLCGGLLGPIANQIITAAGCLWEYALLK